MKTLLRQVALASLTLWILYQIIPQGLYITDNPISTIFKSSGLIVLARIFFRPLANLAFLPINIITMGSFKWVTEVLILFITVYFIDTLTVQAFSTSTFNLLGLTIPSFSFSQLWAYFAIAFMITTLHNFIVWLLN